MPESVDEHVIEPSEPTGAGDDQRAPSHPWRGHARLTLNLTAMIDVVFLLMIYFLVATEFKSDEEVYRLDLPARSPSTQTSDPFDLDQEPLRIVVTSTGDATTAYRLRVDGPYPQPATFEELRRFLDQRRIGPGSPAGLFEVDHPILVAPGPTTRWEHAIEAFNAVARARYENITLAPAG
ncbi:MAG: ExbD/TolR family protein [Planctomycetota bacterium]|jgi:biopolymer transport protein ExbD